MTTQSDEIHVHKERVPDNSVVTLVRWFEGREHTIRCSAQVAGVVQPLMCNGLYFVKMITVKYGESRYRCILCGKAYHSNNKLEPKDDKADTSNR
jgi:hypothetical protein